MLKARVFFFLCYRRRVGTESESFEGEKTHTQRRRQVQE